MPLCRPCRYLPLLFGALLILLSGGRPCLADSFFYFNPDSAQSNLSRLKSEMDSYLTSGGMDLAFQPFVRLHDFDKMANSRQPAFLLVPDWYLKDQGQTLGLQPLLRPRRQGSSSYSKLLLVRQQSPWQTAAELKGKTVAMTSMGPNSLRHLNRLLFHPLGQEADRLNIVTTAKDIDALFALALGQVDAALVAATNMDHVRQINPRITGNLKVLSRSAPIPLPTLCANSKVSVEASKRLKQLFINQRPQAAKLMEMLQIDAWQEIDQ